MLISVIIPVFNCAFDRFEECISSILHQNYTDYEVIVVDDGSTDSHSKTYISLTQNSDNIIYCKQVNQGVSSARNRGLTLARGEYVFFVDADDRVEHNCFEHVVDLLTTYNPDLLLGRVISFPDKKFSQKLNQYFFFRGKKDIKNLKKHMLGLSTDDDYSIIDGPWGRFFKTEIAKKIKFPEEIRIGEDQIYNRLFLEHTDCAILVPDVLYIYCSNPYSAMNSFSSEDYVNEHIKFWEKSYWMYEHESDYYIKKELAKKSINDFYSVVSRYITSERYTRSKVIGIINKLLNQRYYFDTLENISIRDYNSFYKMMRVLIRKSNNAYLIYYMMLLKKKCAMMFHGREKEL